LEFRGVQLDLARQPETLDFIKSFTDFVSRYGFNYLILYLEGRIKTKSFPYRKESESYSPDDMKRIVEYAGKKKIKVVPVVSLLGHAEQFLECPELEHLAELRGDQEGRFSKLKHVFCPSLKETREFLEVYLTEISRLFPSEYFHAGFDETWDIGYCDLCQKRLATETQSDIFTQHLLDCHAIVNKKLKKKMMLWDDMLAIYPQALDRIPRDIIMCSWHYDKLVDKPVGGILGQKTDKFAFYDKLGFKYIFAPAVSSFRNIETFSAYGLKRNPLGALLTAWEMKRRFFWAFYPALAYAGAAWSANGSDLPHEALQDAAVRETTGCEKKEQIGLLKHLLKTDYIMPSENMRGYLRGPLSDGEYERKSFIDFACAALESYSSGTKDRLQVDVLDDLATRVEIESVYFELRELISSLYSLCKPPGAKNRLRKNVALCVEKIKSIKAKRRRQWDAYRKGITPCHTDLYFDSLIKMLADAQTDAKQTKAFLKARFPFNTPNVEFFIRYCHSEKWQKVASGSCSAPFTGSFCYYFPLYHEGVPEAVRIETWGFVGLRISFLEIETRKARFVPASIGAVEGIVRDPESLLMDSWDWCFLGEGEQGAPKKFLNPCLAKVRSVMEIDLKKCEF